MPRFIINNLQLVLLLTLLLPLQSMAAPAITCHCFSDRSYDPTHPTLADPYFLATTQNSFFAAIFGCDKKSIVIKKQKGASAEDLWIAYWVAAKTGTKPEQLLHAKTENIPWEDVIASQRIATKNLGTRFSKALSAKASASKLADMVVDEIFLQHRLLSDPELATLRQSGTANQELIIATLIAVKSGKPAKEILSKVKNRAFSWGSLLHEARIDTKNLQKEFAALLK
jgi:hypothetical protein